MKFKTLFQRTYPHSVDEVWDAIANAEALGEWLMETDFVPIIDRTFRMWCRNPNGEIDTYHCKVLELEAQKRVSWSWILDGDPEQGESFVELTLSQVPEGTQVTIRHRGDIDPAAIDSFEGGWPDKLDQLAAALNSRTTQK